MKRSVFSALPSLDDGGWTPQGAAPDLGALDFLGRAPIPLRRGFKAGLARAAAGRGLTCLFLEGGEWYRTFDGLEAAARSGRAPGMVATTLAADVLGPAVQRFYAPQGAPEEPAFFHPACLRAGLPDPLGVCRVFGVIPFVFLVDVRRLAGRPAPRVWEDLLQPRWRGEIVFGGWRARADGPYTEHNAYLLLALRAWFGDAGLAAFAANTRGLLHTVRLATLFGTGSSAVGAIAVLPWMQAAMCPRRERVRVIWPEDGALALPMFALRRADALARTAPLAAYLAGPECRSLLARSCYPPVAAVPPEGASDGRGMDGAFPAGARLKWPGWDLVRGRDFAATQRAASALFFSALEAEARTCAC